MPAASLAHHGGVQHTIFGRHSTKQHSGSSSNHHYQRNHRSSSASEMSLFSLLWQRDALTLQELLEKELPHDGRSILVKIQCTRDQCPCALNNQDVLLMKPVYDVKLVTGIWNKLKICANSTSNINGKPSQSPNVEKSIKIILTSLSNSWFEVLNESGQSIPYWTQVKDLVRFKPQSLLIRKDIKCMFAKNKSGNGSFDLNSDSTGIIKSGTSLNFIESAKFRVLKSRKIKEVFLVKCSDNNGHLVFLNPEDKCVISPIAGAENISGVHTLNSLLTKFQFPLSVRPIFGPPLPWLSFSDRYHLRLSTCHRGNLLFLASLSNPERFYVVTPEMLEDHIFRVGESELQHHVHLLDKHSTRVIQFLQSYHPYEALRYLIRHLADTTNQLAPIERYSLPMPIAPENKTTNKESVVDDLFEEVEDIYFYVRTGRMPTPASNCLHQTQTSKSSSNDSGLVLVNPRSRQIEALGMPATSRAQRAASCEDLLEGRENKPPPLPPRKYNSPVVRREMRHVNSAKQSAESLNQRSFDSTTSGAASTPQHKQQQHQTRNSTNIVSLYTSNVYL